MFVWVDELGFLQVCMGRELGFKHVCMGVRSGLYGCCVEVFFNHSTHTL